MKIGLIDVDGHNYPNLPLMKLSAWHKKQGDDVRWYEPFDGLMEKYNKVYLSKVFSFTTDYQYPIYADEVVRGGSGYAIYMQDGREIYDKEKDKNLPYEIEHIYPDYSLYPEQTKDTAYGFLTRGCPRGCSFCHVASKEGKCSIKVADLKEFWSGQKILVLCDPNILACKEWRELLEQIVESKAKTNFNQGLDIRLMTKEKAEIIAKIKVDAIHFAWDRYEDREVIEPKFRLFREQSKINHRNLRVFVLCGDRERRVTDQDLYRIYWLRDNGYSPYVMIYDKESLPKGHELKRLQRYVNSSFIFRSCERFEDYRG